MHKGNWWVSSWLFDLMLHKFESEILEKNRITNLLAACNLPRHYYTYLQKGVSWLKITPTTSFSPHTQYYSKNRSLMTFKWKCHPAMDFFYGHTKYVHYLYVFLKVAWKHLDLSLRPSFLLRGERKKKAFFASIFQFFSPAPFQQQ